MASKMEGWEELNILFVLNASYELYCVSHRHSPVMAVYIR